MSVKFSKETSRTVEQGMEKGVEKGKEKGKDDLVHQIGEKLTGGETAKGYLSVRLFA